MPLKKKKKKKKKKERKEKKISYPHDMLYAYARDLKSIKIEPVVPWGKLSQEKSFTELIKEGQQVRIPIP
jgi:hypothetical protein